MIALLVFPAFAFDVACPQAAWQGKVVEISLLSVEANAVSGLFLDQKFKLYKNENGFSGVVGVPINQKPGYYGLILTINFDNGRTEEIRQTITVRPTRFPVTRFYLPPARNKLRAPQIVDDEWGQIEKVLLVEADDRRWQGEFSLPTTAVISQGFGHREVINNKPAGNHRGVDIAAMSGSPVKAPNAGKVVFAGKLKAFGGTMVLDHGQGIHTLYFHLSKFIANVGEEVEKGTAIALSGNTGISSGAHLHWAMSVHNLRVDPMQWVEQEL